MMRLSFVEQSVAGHLIGSDAAVASVATDSRKISGGELFVALRGEQFDGHKFVSEAVRKGAAAALVDTEAQDGIPQVVVDDTEQSLGMLAATWRTNFDLPIVAVTGSSGKTTVKNMVGMILTEQGKTLVAQGSFNNSIGLPMTLLQLRDFHEYAVVEIGMNHVGEIAPLSKICAPTVAVITNAGPAHLLNLGSIDQVAIEKSSIVSGLSQNGTMVLNADDPRIDIFTEAACGCKIVTFGFNSDSDVSAEYEILPYESEVILKTPLGDVEFRLPIPGKHNIANAMAAAAATISTGATLNNIHKGLESVSSVSGRLMLKSHFAGGALLDDTYNANPNSVAAALNVLAKLGGDRRVVLGDMLELGEEAENLHRQTGQLARQLGIGRLYTYGNLSRHISDAFGYGAHHYGSHEEIIEVLKRDASQETTILVKGSRGMKMEDVVAGLQALNEESIC